MVAWQCGCRQQHLDVFAALSRSYASHGFLFRLRKRALFMQLELCCGSHERTFRVASSNIPVDSRLSVFVLLWRGALLQFLSPFFALRSQSCLTVVPHGIVAGYSISRGDSVGIVLPPCGREQSLQRHLPADSSRPNPSQILQLVTVPQSSDREALQ